MLKTIFHFLLRVSSPPKIFNNKPVLCIRTVSVSTAQVELYVSQHRQKLQERLQLKNLSDANGSLFRKIL